MAKILVVDDRPTNRDLLVTILGYRKHRVLQAGDGEEALRVVRSERPELVIADILMPVLDGYGFVRLLRADSEIGHTPVIFWSAGYLADEARTLAHACGVTEILTKPCEPGEIFEKVEFALGNKAETTTPSVDAEFGDKHLRLLTDKLAQKVDELENEIVERKRVELALRESQELLESRVRERTAELASANESLRTEIEARERVESEQAKLILELQEALAKVKTLSGLLPICSSCKNIRDDAGYWHRVESYVSMYAEVQFSHGICPDCMKSLYPEQYARIQAKKKGI